MGIETDTDIGPEGGASGQRSTYEDPLFLCEGRCSRHARLLKWAGRHRILTAALCAGLLSILADSTRYILILHEVLPEARALLAFREVLSAVGFMLGFIALFVKGQSKLLAIVGIVLNIAAFLGIGIVLFILYSWVYVTLTNMRSVWGLSNL